MRTATLFFTLVFLSGSLAGCVSKSRYRSVKDKLKKARTQMDQRLDQRAALMKGLTDTVARRDAKIAKLEQQIESKRRELAQRDQRIDRGQAELRNLEAQLAAVVRDRSRLKASAVQLQSALAELSKRKAEADRRVAQFRDLLKRFKTLIDAGKLKVKIVDGRMVLALPTDVLFPSGSAKLQDEGQQAIAEVAQVLGTLPDRRFQVEGHTDNVPIKTSRFPSNWELASARAVVVVKTMIASGLTGQRISAASFGKFRPVAANDTDEGKASNRRIEIVVVPDLSSLPGFDELQKAVAGK